MLVSGVGKMLGSAGRKTHVENLGPGGFENGWGSLVGLLYKQVMLLLKQSSPC